jgi:hypothetical protein
MSRHTHPPAISKHEREYVRAQRRRYISKRFVRAKRDGTLTYINLHARFTSQRTWGQESVAALALATYLEERGLTPPADVVAWSARAMHPQELLSLPPGLSAATNASPMRGPAAIGQLAKQNAFWHNRCQCAGCRPQKQDGYRRRNRNAWEGELAAELAEHAEHADEDLDGGGGPVIERRHGGWGWCSQY